VTHIWTGYIANYGYASADYEGAVDIGMQATSTFLDLAEEQAHYFAMASDDANGEKSGSRQKSSPKPRERT
jgi:hypothetical protein